MTKFQTKASLALLGLGIVLAAFWFISGGQSPSDLSLSQTKPAKTAPEAAQLRAVANPNFPQQISNPEEAADVKAEEATEPQQEFVKPKPSEPIREAIDPKQPGNFVALNGICLRLVETVTNGNADETEYIFDVQTMNEKQEQSEEVVLSKDLFKSRWGFAAFNQALLLAEAEGLKDPAGRSQTRQ